MTKRDPQPSTAQLNSGSQLEAHDQLTRDDVEAAMDKYDEFQKSGKHNETFYRFGGSRDFWVRSTRQRPNRIYPSKPIVGCVLGLGKTELRSGWKSKKHAAAMLHNSGFIIVNKDDKPIKPQMQYEQHLIRDADRIRHCALNYYIKPAQKQSKEKVSIRAGTLANHLFLGNRMANVCQALGGPIFQALANVSLLFQDGPDDTTTTTFTYNLLDDGKQPTMDSDAQDQTQTTTNLILYGPPGIGKTYETARYAVQLCLGDNAAATLRNDRKKLMDEYQRLVSKGRIEFVTFHQSFSYEEFVEGLRPPVSDKQAEGAGFRLEVELGILRQMAKRAKDSSDMISLEDRKVFKLSLGNSTLSKDAILFDQAIAGGYAIFGHVSIDLSHKKYDDPDEISKACQEHSEKNGRYRVTDKDIQMTGYFRNQLCIGDIVIVSKGNKLIRAIGKVTGDYEFHPRQDDDYGHQRTVQWLWTNPEGIPVSQVFSGQFTQQTIYRLSVSDLNVPALERYMNSGNADEVPQPYVLIIDEINRANISKVFGELITILEPDKRINAENEITVTLPYSKDKFGLPSNLHIIGTMNTADRSIALLDTALRRRFSFRELMPDSTTLDKDVGGINLQTLLATINERIEYLFDREHQIGHAYFIGCSDQTDVENVMRHKVIPLLAEYFYEDWSKVAAVLGDRAGADKTHFLEAKELSPPEGFNDDETGDEKKWRWSVKEEFDFSGFTA